MDVDIIDWAIAMASAYVFDLEGDSLTPTIIHCLCYHSLSTNESKSLTNYDDMRAFVEQADILIGHNIQRFDIPVLERILAVKIKAKLVDTLALSWYLEPDRVIHGLEEWGEFFGVPKPPISDWKTLPLTEYIHRCEEDVKINTKLWKRFRAKLIRIYGDWEKAKKLLSYLEFKMDCAREQERSKWKLDRDMCLKSLRTLQEAREAKLATLVAAMPRIPLYAQRRRPARPFKKDGTFSTSGARWFALLDRLGHNHDFMGVIDEQVGEKSPNPSSHVQVKNWLYSLGWKPDVFKYDRDKETGEIKKLPQIKEEHSEHLSPSVLRLVDINPAIADLEGLGVINHRIGLLNGFLANVDSDDAIVAGIQGLTNTLRFIHKTAVNLPKVDKPYAEGIRACLVAPEGYELCGSDMSSLEDRLKQHFIFPYDPEYVKEMNVEGYDPHLALAKLGGEVTDEQIEAYKSGTNKSIKPIRDIFKNGNYACQYGAMPPRLSLTANISLSRAKEVWEIYWQKNWAIKEVSKNQKTQTINGQMWLFNPISELWYSLRYEKDIFSTLVQGSAAYVFDVWVMNVRRKRPQLTAQFHDEIVLCVRKGYREQAKKLLFRAIDETNDQLQLNRKLGIDVQFGDRYSEIH